MRALKASLIVLPLIAVSAHAFIRTALFDEQLKGRAAIVERKGEIFTNETDEQKKRPIWLHGGDSLSTAYRTRTLLREVYEVAANQEPLPPEDPKQLASTLPSTDRSWYAGRRIDWGLLGLLERATRQEWLLVSAALAGTTMIPAPPLNEEHFERMQKALIDRNRDGSVSFDERARVKLITFSLGANDLCAGRDPLAAPGAKAKLQKRLSNLRADHPNAKIVAWEVVEVVDMREHILAELEKLPDGTAKRRVIEFCKASWNHSCKAAAEKPAQMRAWRDELQRTLTPLVDRNVNVIRALQGEILDLMSGDCFHPSGDSQESMATSMIKAYLK